MTDKKKEEAPPIFPDSAMMPWEKGSEPTKDVEKDLFELLGSDPEFQEEEDADDADELESDDEEEDESDEQESDDDEDDEEDDLKDDEEEDSEEDEDDEDSDEEDEDQEDEEELYEVKVQGETLKVNLEDLRAGYSRTEDYTRKRQSDVEEHATEMKGVRAQREQYDADLAQLEAVMKDMTPAEPDLEQLRKDNPTEYLIQKQEHADKLAALGKVATERERVQAESVKEDDAARAVYAQGEFEKMVAAVPEWQNEAVRATEIGELRDFAKANYEFSDDDLNGVSDHRMILLLRDAKQTQEKTKKGKKEIRKKSKGARKMKPGTRTTRRKVRSQDRKATERARKTLAQTGSVHDAASAIERMLGDDD